MNIQFSSIIRPNCENLSFLQPLNLDFTQKFVSYDWRNHLQSNKSFIAFDDFRDINELFFKKKEFLARKSQIQREDDIIEENIITSFDEFKLSINPKMNLLFDVSPKSANIENFHKYLETNFYSYDISNLENLPYSTKDTVIVIEPFLFREYSILQEKCSNYPFLLNITKMNEKYKSLMKFDLGTNYYTTFEKFPLFDQKKKNDVINQLPCDLDILTSHVFIPNEINEHAFAEQIIQPESYFDQYLNSMKVMTLKFNCESTMCFEPFTKEWLTELQISKKDFDEQIDEKKIFIQELKALPKYSLKNSNKIQFTVDKNVSEEYSPIFFRDLSKNQRFVISDSTDETMKNSYEANLEKEIQSEDIPTIVRLNTLLFSNEDIAFFGKLFQNLKFIGVELNETLLLTINDKIANIFLVDNDFDLMNTIISELYNAFNQIIVTTTVNQYIVLSPKIKWRRINSHSQIVTAILPYLIEENANNKSITDI